MTTKVVQRLGCRFHVRPHTKDLAILDEDVPERKLAHFEPNDVWLDIGGHIGAFAVPVSKWVRRVITIEPDLENFLLLARNLAENQCHNVVAIRAAVGAENTDDIWLYRTRLWDTSGYTTQEAAAVGAEAISRVPSVSFADVLRYHQPTKIKMDCEGAEYALLGSTSLWYWQARELLIEYHRWHLKDDSYDLLADILERLRQHFQTVECGGPEHIKNIYAGDPMVMVAA